MPYIKKDRRTEIDCIIDLMVEKGIKADGDLNYILFSFAKRFVKPSYNNYKNYIGELNETVTEIRRKLLGIYEDEKIIENGDIPFYSHKI
jgi:hypothetical protein